VKEIQANLIRQYGKRKGWSGNQVLESASFEQYEKELKNSGIEPRAKILEVGFGEGKFLDWARNNGHIVSGIELNEALCMAAKEREHDVYLGELNEVLETLPFQYNAIVAFDVLEHMTLDEISKFLRSSRKLLLDQGVVLARFPNGRSPFGRVNQYGDATHLSVLSGPIMEDLAMLSGMKLIRCSDSERAYPAKPQFFKRFMKSVHYLLRDMATLIVLWLFFDCRIPLDANISVTLTKAEEI
jgi:2-polyprenyl-3-methyl-5-hydroxy-6-metoxy-1,4-benzoquinol methylase